MLFAHNSRLHVGILTHCAVSTITHCDRPINKIHHLICVRHMHDGSPHRRANERDADNVHADPGREVEVSCYAPRVQLPPP